MKKIMMAFIGLGLTTSVCMAKDNSKNSLGVNSVCASLVKPSAKKLFTLHYGKEDESENGGATFSDVKQLPAVNSPDGKRKYTVLETVAEIGKQGEYRIRMIYALIGDTHTASDCILMGQEILDLSSL